MRFFAPLFLLLFSTFAWADAYIPEKHRVKNEWPGYCSWASIETLCRHQKIKAGYGLKEARKLDPDFICPSGEIIPKNFGRDEPIGAKLDSLGIRYKMHPSGLIDEAGLEQILSAVSSGRGAIVAVSNGQPTTKLSETHVIVVLEFNDSEYLYFDSNDPGKNYRGSRAWFHSVWNGFVLTLD